MPGGPGQGTWLGLPTMEGPVGQRTHIPGAQRSTFTQAHSPPWESPTHGAPPAASTLLTQNQAAFRPSHRQACLQEPKGKVFPETPPLPYREDLLLQDQPPLSILQVPPAAGQDNGGYSGLHGVFKALAGPLPWGTRGLDLGKTFLKLLLPRLW